MKKKKLLKIVNNELELNKFLLNANEEEILLSIKQSIEVKNINSLRKIIEYCQNYKNNKVKQFMFNEAVNFSLNQNHFESIEYLIKNKNFIIDNEFILNSIKSCTFPPYDKSLNLILENIKFNKEQYTLLTVLYLINTDFIEKENILNTLKLIYSYYNFSSKEIYDFLILNDLLKSIQFNEGFGTEFSFIDFIIHFDKDNYIIKKIEEYFKFIDPLYIQDYINHFNKIKNQEKFDNF